MANIVANAFWTFVWKTVESYAISAITNKLFGKKSQNTSPTYSFGTLQTQTNSGMSMALIYGQVKCAGNVIWANNGTKVRDKLVGFGVGKIKSFSDVRINDNEIASLSGCNYTAYVGDGEQSIDSRVPGAKQADKAKIVGGLKYDAYLAITATASEKVSSDGYTVTAIVKGRIVRIYTSPTTYYEDWTDNPAWCFLDYMTSVDGCGMTVSTADIQACLNAAAYFDQVVNGKKRFTVNLILDEKKSHQDWINEILATCRGYRTYQRGMHGILVDKPESVSQIFTVKPDEDIEIWWQDLEEDIERLQIEYIDPDYEYTKVLAQADRTQLEGETRQFRNSIPLTKKISIYGINNFEQASREAWFHLNKAQTCPGWIRYKTNKRALNRTIGDVVGIRDPITQLTERGLDYKRYRIMSMSEPQGLSIEMVMQEYNPNLYGDTMGSVAPVINITKLDNPFSIPPPVTNLILSEYGWLNSDGVHISNIDVYWDEIDYQFFYEYLVSISVDSGLNWSSIASPPTPNYRISNVITGQKYLVAVQVRNRYGLLSEMVISEITIVGKDEPPSNVSQMTITQSGKNLYVVIVQISDPDLRKYELRLGSTWGSSVLVQQFIGNSMIIEAPSNGTLTYWVKAIDNSGNYSETATKAIVNVVGLPARNIIYTESPAQDTWIVSNMWKDLQGRYRIASRKTLRDYEYIADIFGGLPLLRDDAEILLPAIDLGPTAVDESCYWTDNQGNMRLKTVQTLADFERFSDIFNAKLTYVEPNYAIETLLGVDVTYQVNRAAYIEIEYRTSLNGEQWSDWIPSMARQFMGRYLQVRLLPRSQDGYGQVYVSGATVSIDVPDIDEIIENIVIPAETTRIYFKKKFTEVKTIDPYTRSIEGVLMTNQITNKTSEYFDIVILDNGLPASGILEKATIRGY